MNKGVYCEEAVRKVGQVEAEVGYTVNSLDCLGNAISRLEDRLFQVLRCQPPQTGEEAKEDMLVPLAESARRNRHNIESIHSQVENILSRLEL
jgi:hypothetical protein